MVVVGKGRHARPGQSDPISYAPSSTATAPPVSSPWLKVSAPLIGFGPGRGAACFFGTPVARPHPPRNAEPHFLSRPGARIAPAICPFAGLQQISIRSSLSSFALGALSSAAGGRRGLLAGLDGPGANLLLGFGPPVQGSTIESARTPPRAGEYGRFWGCRERQAAWVRASVWWAGGKPKAKQQLAEEDDAWHGSRLAKLAHNWSLSRFPFCMPGLGKRLACAARLMHADHALPCLMSRRPVCVWVCGCIRTACAMH